MGLFTLYEFISWRRGCDLSITSWAGWIAQSVQWLSNGLDGRGSTPGMGRDSSLHHRVQTGSGAYPASYTIVTVVSLCGGKAAGAWNWPLTSMWCRG
jgi:hypothetical protein